MSGQRRRQRCVQRQAPDQQGILCDGDVVAEPPKDRGQRRRIGAIPAERIGRIDEDQSVAAVRRRRDGRRGGRAGYDDRLAGDADRRQVRPQCLKRHSILLHETAEARAAREGLDSEVSDAGEQVQDGHVRQLARPAPTAAETIEERLLDSIKDRPSGIARSGDKPAAAKPSDNDAHSVNYTTCRS